jgi:hypothetical protein
VSETWEALQAPEASGRREGSHRKAYGSGAIGGETQTQQEDGADTRQKTRQPDRIREADPSNRGEAEGL